MTTRGRLVALQPVVERYCRGRLGPGPVAAGATEETLRRVGAALPVADDDLPAVVYRTAHEVVDELDAGDPGPPAGARGSGGVAVLPGRRLRAVADLPEGETARHRTPGAAAMAALLRLLPAELREVLVLRVAAGLPVGTVAGLVGSSPEAVRVTQHRAMARLRALAADPGVA